MPIRWFTQKCGASRPSQLVPHAMCRPVLLGRLLACEFRSVALRDSSGTPITVPQYLPVPCSLSMVPRKVHVMSQTSSVWHFTSFAFAPFGQSMSSNHTMRPQFEDTSRTPSFFETMKPSLRWSRHSVQQRNARWLAPLRTAIPSPSHRRDGYPANSVEMARGYNISVHLTAMNIHGHRNYLNWHY